MEGIDRGGVKGSVQGYLDRSREILDPAFLEFAEGEIAQLQQAKGFSFPTNEGMRKVTKHPEVEKIDRDPVLARLETDIRTTIRGIQPREGGIYAGVNAFHHGHIAYLSKSEGVVAVDMNKLVPYGFAFIVGLVGGAKTPEDFRAQTTAMAANPELFREVFQKTELGETPLVKGTSAEVREARDRMLRGLVSVMQDFDPFVHGPRVVPPVFCTDNDAYNYFRTLVVQDRVAGARSLLQGNGMMGILARALGAFQPRVADVNTLYTSSCFDPRFAKPKARADFFRDLRTHGFRDVQVVESFLNSGWIVYDIVQ